MRGLIGLALLLAVAYAISSNRSKIPWRTVAVGLAIQVAFAVLVLRWSVGKDVLDFVAGQVKALIDYTNAGIEFLVRTARGRQQATIFAFQVLPVIIFLGALVGLLFYLRVIQWFVEIVGGAIAWLMRTTKVESVYAATVIFLGQSEAPLMIQAYLNKLTRSELFVVMTGGVRVGRGLDAGRLRAARRAAAVPARRGGDERARRALLRPHDHARDRGVEGRRERPRRPRRGVRERDRRHRARRAERRQDRGHRRLPADRFHLADRARQRAAGRRRRDLRLRRPDVPEAPRLGVRARSPG